MLEVFDAGLQGLVPPSGGGVTNFLRADGTWGAPPGGAGGDDTCSGATSLDTACYAGDTNGGVCTWSDPDGTVNSCICDAAKTLCITSHVQMYADGPMDILNENKHACQRMDNVTGLVTYFDTGNCQRPKISKPFDGSIFNVGAGVTIEAVSLNGWPASPVLDGPDSDTGPFALVIPMLWDDYAADGVMTFRVTCHSITNQNGLSLQMRVGAAVCTGDGEALGAYSAPNAGQLVICTFGNQVQDVQVSNTVTLSTTGCAAGEKLHLPFTSELDTTAVWSTAGAFITGGMLTYETVGTPVLVALGPTPALLRDTCDRVEPDLDNSNFWTQKINSGQVSTMEATGAVCRTAATGSGSVYNTTGTFGPNMEAYLTIGDSSPSGNIDLYVRLQNAGTTTPSGFVLQINETLDTLTLLRVDSGSFLQIVSPVNQEVSSGDIVMLRAIGTEIQGIYCPGGVNCVVLMSQTDTAHSAAGKIGFGSNNQLNTLDNLGGGTTP